MFTFMAVLIKLISVYWLINDCHLEVLSVRTVNMKVIFYLLMAQKRLIFFNSFFMLFFAVFEL